MLLYGNSGCTTGPPSNAPPLRWVRQSARGAMFSRQYRTMRIFFLVNCKSVLVLVHHPWIRRRTKSRLSHWTITFKEHVMKIFSIFSK